MSPEPDIFLFGLTTKGILMIYRLVKEEDNF